MITTFRQDLAVRDKTRQDRTGQDRTGQDRTAHGTARQRFVRTQGFVVGGREVDERVRLPTSTSIRRVLSVPVRVCCVRTGRPELVWVKHCP